MSNDMVTNFYEISWDNGLDISYCGTETYIGSNVNVVVVKDDVAISTDVFKTLVGRFFYVRAKYTCARKKFYSLEDAEVKELIDDAINYPAHNRIMRETNKRRRRIMTMLRELQKIAKKTESLAS